MLFCGILFDWRRDVVAVWQNLVAVINVADPYGTPTFAVKHEKADAEHFDIIRADLAAFKEALKGNAYGAPLVVDFKREIVDSKIAFAVFHQIEVRSINGVPIVGLDIEDDALEGSGRRSRRPEIDNGTGKKIASLGNPHFQHSAELRVFYQSRIESRHPDFTICYAWSLTGKIEGDSLMGSRTFRLGKS